MSCAEAWEGLSKFSFLLLCIFSWNHIHEDTVLFVWLGRRGRTFDKACRRRVQYTRIHSISHVTKCNQMHNEHFYTYMGCSKALTLRIQAPHLPSSWLKTLFSFWSLCQHLLQDIVISRYDFLLKMKSLWRNIWEFQCRCSVPFMLSMQLPYSSDSCRQACTIQATELHKCGPLSFSIHSIWP